MLGLVESSAYPHFPLTLALRVQCRADRQPRLLNSIEIATIVSTTVTIKQSKMLINLIQSDIWRPLGDLVFRLRIMRIMPYRTAENVIAGTFVDINSAICRLTQHAGTSHPFETLS